MRKLLFTLLLAVSFTSIYAQSLNDIKNLNEELKVVLEKDQSIRSKLVDEGKRFQGTGDKSAIDSLMKELLAADRSNQVFVERVLDSIGWPKGLEEDANFAIFLVIDHAGLGYQKKYLDLVKSQSEARLISPGDYATLADRVLMKSGQPQQYGTQTISINGITSLWPVSDPENLNQLRAEAGLGPIEDYLFVAESTYGKRVEWDTTKTVESFRMMFK